MTYFEYLVKWKGHPTEDASWVNEYDIQKHGKTLQELMDKSPLIFGQRNMMHDHLHEH